MRALADRETVMLLLVGVAVRAIAMAAYNPQMLGDSPAYMAAATGLPDGLITGSDGQRPPGYPLMLLLLGRDATSAWIAQALLGIVGSIIVLRTARMLGFSQRLSVAVAVLSSVTPYVFFIEAFILSDALATFAATACTYFLVRYLTDARRTPHAVAAGAIGAAAGLVRPQLFIVGPVFVGLLVLANVTGRIWRSGTGAPLVAAAAAALVVPSVAGYLALSMVNSSRFDTFSPTTLVGINVMSTVGNVAQFAPPEQKETADLYVRLRNRRYARQGTHVLTEVEVVEELADDGIGFPEASGRLRSLATSLIRVAPERYIENVLSSFALSWKPAHTMPSGGLRSWAQPVRRAHYAVVVLDLALRYLLLLAAALASVWAFVSLLLGRLRTPAATALGVFGGCLLATALTQSIVTYGDMNRPLMTFFPMMLQSIAGVLSTAHADCEGA